VGLGVGPSSLGGGVGLPGVDVGLGEVGGLVGVGLAEVALGRGCGVAGVMAFAPVRVRRGICRTGWLTPTPCVAVACRTAL
jgi:hypothetical protein